MFTSDANQWAVETFSKTQLGDPRRTKRLVKLAGCLADNLGQSLVQSQSNPADVEAAYRFTRNPAIKADAIAQAGFAAPLSWSSNTTAYLP